MEPNIHIPSPTEINLGWESHWKPNEVARFWNWQNANPITQELYYSKMVGRNVLEQARRIKAFGERSVDYGAAPGYLTEELLKMGQTVLSADVSPGSLEKLNGRLKGQKNFLGVALIHQNGVDIKDASADSVFLLETIEHLSDELLKKTLSEILRILKPGGALVITTPNDEELEKSKVYCPNCGCIFHRVQHQRSFNKTTLKDALTHHQFKVIHSKPTLFLNGSGLRRQMFRFAHKLRNGKLPHLMAVAVKPS